MNHIPAHNPARADRGDTHSEGALEGPVRLSSGADVAALVPYLLGFHPADSIVILAFEDARLALTARFGLEYCDHPDIVDDRLRAIRLQLPFARYLVAAFTEDQRAAGEALQMMELLIGDRALIDSMHISAERYWSRLCNSADCCPPEGTPYEAGSSSAAVQAIVAGLQALPARESLESFISPPRGGAAQAARRNVDAAIAWAVQASGEQRAAVVDELLDRGLADPQALGTVELARLATLMGMPELRDRALRRLSRPDADSHVNLWGTVARATPRAEQAPILGLVGMAAWVGGNGALQVVCLERAERTRIWHPLLEILSDVNQAAAPPALWDQLLIEMFGDPAMPSSARGSGSRRLSGEPGADQVGQPHAEAADEHVA